ncbi:MAG: hypothetical protein AABO41_22695 [Acidobacteriota bacterium]
MKGNIHPEAVGLFGPAAVVPRTKGDSRLIEQVGFWRGCLRRLLAAVGRYT